LLEPPPPSYAKVNAKPKLEFAVLQSGALYAAMSVLFLYLLAIPVVLGVTVRKGGGWRPPRDLAFPANVLAMVYDSSLMDRVKESPGMDIGNGIRQDNVAEDWRKMKWGFGVFRGAKTGELRIGIEAMDKLESIRL
jgi:hypothetical protein